MEILRKVKNVRKRIWEVDCLSMDAALAGSFDWRELANFLEGAGRLLPQDTPESFNELNIQGLIHQYCHYENALSVRLETLLNKWHREILSALEFCEREDLMRLVLGFSFESRRQSAGMMWALGSDPRPEAACVRKRFHQRFQMLSMRRLS